MSSLYLGRQPIQLPPIASFSQQLRAFSAPSFLAIAIIDCSLQRTQPLLHQQADNNPKCYLCRVLTNEDRGLSFPNQADSKGLAIKAGM